MNWIDGVLGLTEGQWVTVVFMSSALTWLIVLVVWYRRTRPKTK
ncbi:MAG: hypothetical protein ABI988_04675 [Nitrospirota bacterium]